MAWTLTFAAWEDADSRDEFFDSTLGVGMMTPFFRSPAVVYSFENAPVELFQNASPLHLQLYTFDNTPSERQIQDFTKRWTHASQANVFSYAWRINEEAVTFLGLADAKGTPAHDSIVTDLQFDYHTQVIDLEPPIVESSTTPSEIDLPKNTPDLLRVNPITYGTLAFDQTEIGIAAYPNDLEFRPMRNMADSSWFPYDEDYLSMFNSYERHMSIIALYLTQNFEEEDLSNLSAICKEIATQPGLDRLYWCRDESDPKIIRLIAGKQISLVLVTNNSHQPGWKDMSSYRAFESFVKSSKSFPKDKSYIERDPKLDSYPVRYLPEWNDGAIVEPLTFTFRTALTKQEKSAFVWYLHQFLW
ncbi:hypothetical protein N0V90_006911 [Kalmusia sp. IMI 367209]|nr:hypothetical protein N0V90_006911 [Kalmusia sp. IMI 367209]